MALLVLRRFVLLQLDLKKTEVQKNIILICKDIVLCTVLFDTDCGAILYNHIVLVAKCNIGSDILLIHLFPFGCVIVRRGIFFLINNYLYKSLPPLKYSEQKKPIKVGKCPLPTSSCLHSYFDHLISSFRIIFAKTILSPMHTMGISSLNKEKKRSHL